MSNRRDRRRRAKLARDASTEEIFPGAHGPVQNTLVEAMRVVLDALRDTFPGHDVTLFMAERPAADGSGPLPRFNYMSTGAREDMMAVLRAFIAKNDEWGDKLDRINDAPPTETRQ